MKKGDHAKAGLLSSIVDLICDIALFVSKFILGLVSHSVAISTDAFNNLSDCASCLFALFGYRLSAKPADAGHPFGHGRLEYLISQLIAVLIVLVSLELFKTSYQRIIDPQPIIFSWWVIAGLVVSIGVKVWMGRFNAQLNKESGSSILVAVSRDSYSDAAATSVTLFSYVIAPFISFPLDAIVGLAVSILIFIGALRIFGDTISQLLGQPCSEQEYQRILDIIANTDGILGVHDLLVHNYGPMRQIASAHVEVDGYQTVSQAHAIVDRLERRLLRETGVDIVLHMDPVEPNDLRTVAAKEQLTAALSKIDSRLSFHDFRIIAHHHPVWCFDLVVPYDMKIDENELRQKLTDALAVSQGALRLDIRFDRNFMG